MKRIGIVASKIAKDNFLIYNFFVFLLSFLFSLLVFFLSGFSLILGLALISYITRGSMIMGPGTGFWPLLSTCMISLAVVVGLINMVAILMNVKLKK